jgi:predicted esterase
MPYSLVHNGVLREFDFYAPPGWQHWVGKAWERGRVGLPLVVALHGGAQDPLGFQEDWFFPRVWGLSLDSNGNPGDPVAPGAARVLANQFFVLFPYGMGWTTASLHVLAYTLIEPADVPPAPAGSDFRPLYRDGRTIRAWNAGFAVSSTMVDDVSFIAAAVDTAGDMLNQALHHADNDLPDDLQNMSPASLFDVERRYLFGYSNGAMLGYRLVKEMPDHWAALWAMSSTCGGKPHVGVSPERDRVVNLPESGEFAVSLFAHHGDLDDTVPPGSWEESQFLQYQTPQRPDPLYVVYALAGYPNALDYRPGLLPLTHASSGYRDYNNLTGDPPLRSRRGLGGPRTAQSKSWPNVADPNDANPTVVVYRDPDMRHTGFTSSPRRYFHEKEVWRFFGYHPRVAR